MGRYKPGTMDDHTVNARRISNINRRLKQANTPSGSQINQTTAQLDKLESPDIPAQINTAIKQASEAKAAAKAAENKASAAETTASEAKTTADQAKDSTVTLTSQVTELSTKVSQLTTDLTALTDRVAALEQQGGAA